MSDDDIIVESPCTDNCRLSDDNICLGCFRSLEEMNQWNAASNEERIVMLKNANQRQRAKLEKKS